MSSSHTSVPTPEGPGSVSGAPNLPAGFTDTFTSRYIDTGGLRQHAVIGGDGPPLLLVRKTLSNPAGSPPIRAKLKLIARSSRNAPLPMQSGYLASQL